MDIDLSNFIYIFLFQGMDLKSVLPDPDVLFSSEELSDLSKDKNFRFLVKSGYEHVDRVAREQDRLRNVEDMEQ